MNCHKCGLPKSDIAGSVLHQCMCHWQSPPQRPVAEPHKWVGLTDAERLEIAKQNMLSGLDAFAKAIEAKLKEKNT